MMNPEDLTTLTTPQAFGEAIFLHKTQEERFRKLNEASVAGNKIAQNYMGLLAGTGNTKHKSKPGDKTFEHRLEMAIKCFKSAADQEFAPADFNLGVCLHLKEHLATNQEERQTHHRLGYFYCTRAKSQDYEKVAKSWEMCGSPLISAPVLNYLQPIKKDSIIRPFDARFQLFYIKAFESMDRAREDESFALRKVKEGETALQSQLLRIRKRTEWSVELQKKIQAESENLKHQLKLIAEKRKKIAELEKLALNASLPVESKPLILSPSSPLKGVPPLKITLDDGEEAEILEFPKMPDQATLENLELDEMIRPVV